MKDFITVIGGGLAGCEASYQIAKRGIKVKLYEMKPVKFSPAHNNKNLAEIVCSNSFKSNLLTNACGLLKEELRRLDSLLIKTADETSIPAGQALAVDREVFSKRITEKIELMENIEVVKEEFTSEMLEKAVKEGIVIIATGPLTSDELSKGIQKLTGENDLHFYDAAAPIIEKDSINFDIAFYGNRYEQEKKKDETEEEWKARIIELAASQEDYINLPVSEEEYYKFVTELNNAEVVTLHDFEKKEIFSGCMPVEIMSKNGEDTLRFGPLKPVGFDDPRTCKRPFAVVQLRQDNSEGNLYNMVGFQTNLKFGEQKRVFQMIPGLENAEFAKYGVMHRNTFINSPELLDSTYNFKKNTNIYFAGQITGVEGYVESIASGLVASLNAVKQFKSATNGAPDTVSNKALDRDFEKLVFDQKTMIGALASYISSKNASFQPMNANYGILPSLTDEEIEAFGMKKNVVKRDKKAKYGLLSERALKNLQKID